MKDAMEQKKISFPRYAEYSCAFKYIVEQALGCKYVMPPALTKRTMDLGTKHSPDFVCTPFKTMLGSMIESLEAGADTLLMTHGLCRWGTMGSFWSRFCGIWAISLTSSTCPSTTCPRKRNISASSAALTPR